MSISTLDAATVGRSGVTVAHHFDKDDCDEIRKHLIGLGIIDWSDPLEAGDVEEVIHDVIDSAISHIRQSNWENGN
jgi:hypothetical protein